MNNHLIIAFSILTLFVSCQTSTKSKQDEKSVLQIDTLQLDSSKTSNQFEETLKTIPQNIKPIFGYRFILTGDFDGDGNKEKLIEHFFSRLDNKETNKFYDGLTDYFQLVTLTVKKEPFSFVISNNKKIDTLHIAFGGQLLGLSYLKNEGDLNGDGNDEISYVVNWADWSNLNTWHIATYKNNKWTKIYSFPIWDWQLPNLPETFNQYGLFGLEQKTMSTTNDTTNRRIEKEFKNFKGLVKKVYTNKIQVIFRNEVPEIDTMIVDIKQLQ